MVQQFNDTPDWQGYNQAGQQVLNFASFFKLNAGVTAIQLPAAAGQVITLYTATFMANDTSGTSIAFFDNASGFAFMQYPAYGKGAQYINFGGQRLSVGGGFSIRNTGIVNMSFSDNFAIMLAIGT